MSKEPSTIKSIKMRNNVIADVETLAAQENRNFSNMAETLIIRAIKTKQNENHK